MYSLDEIGLIPAATSSIKHRADVNPFYGNKLPIFVAPMTCLLNLGNWGTFYNSKVIPIWPIRDANNKDRELPPSNLVGWVAMTIEEFKWTFNACRAYEAVPKGHFKVLIDCANGNMEELFSIVKDAKQEYGDKLVVMIGNIANPETYLECCKAGVDYVRVGIGGGSGCTTSVQTGIHASMPWILEGIKGIKNRIHNYEVSAEIGMRIYDSPEIAAIKGFRTKIVADGGITNPSRAIKCLALGADYVMMGKVFAHCKEVNHMRMESPEIGIRNQYYGQSSEQGQIDRFGKVKANPEGTSVMVSVDTTLKEFTDKFEAALRSAMSYCGAKTLNDFIGKVKYEYMSPDEFKSYNK